MTEGKKGRHLRFDELYDIEGILDCEQPKVLKPKPERTCRFCGLDSTKTKFKALAHIIPEGLGNRHLVSDFECDTCNNIFSNYENSLASFLGIARTLDRTKGKKGIPSFKSNDRDLKASHTHEFGVDGIFIEKQEGSSAIKTDSTHKTVFTFSTQGYKPLHIYKALYKMALSTCLEDSQPWYTNGYSFLTTTEFDETLLPSAFTTNVIRTGKFISSPYGVLFRRKSNKYPTLAHHVFQFYVNDYIFQIALAFNQFENYPIDVVICPPIFTELIENVKLEGALFDFSSVKTQTRKETIVMEPNLVDAKNLVAYDPKTGEIIASKFNPDDIKGVLLVRKGTSINLDKNSSK